MSSTLQDVAAESGFSVSTVSRVLNGKAEEYRISEETCRIVEEAAKKLNYQPNSLARSLSLRETLTIGLIIPDISNPFFAQVTRSIQKRLQQKGYTLMVCDTSEDVDSEREHVELLRSKRVDGIIIMPEGEEHEHLEVLKEEDIPTILLDRYLPDLNLPAVVVDNREGAFQATAHLIERGHRRIGFIEGLSSTYTNQRRLAGYRRALRNKDLPLDGDLIVGGSFRTQGGYTGVGDLFALDTPPTAIFASSNLIAVGALRALDELGLSIPEEVSLVIFDDPDFASIFRPPITAVAQPTAAIGHRAVDMLLEQIGGTQNGEVQRLVLSPELIVRDSVMHISDAYVPSLE